MSKSSNKKTGNPLPNKNQPKKIKKNLFIDATNNQNNLNDTEEVSNTQDEQVKSILEKSDIQGKIDEIIDSVNLSGLKSKDDVQRQSEVQNPDTEAKNDSSTDNDTSEQNVPNNDTDTVQVKENGIIKRFDDFVTANRDKKVPLKKMRSTWLAILGAVLIVLSVVGLITTIRFSVDLTQNVINKTSLKEELEKYIIPFVVVDSPEFENSASLDDSVKIQTAVWKLIIYSDLSKYESDNYGNIFVPQADIEFLVKSLYGSNVSVVHQSVGDPTFFGVTYDGESGKYIIQSQPQFVPYAADIQTIQPINNGYLLEVDYIVQNPLSQFAQSNNEDTKLKRMQYKLVKQEDSTYKVEQIKLITIYSDGVYQPNESSDHQAA